MAKTTDKLLDRDRGLRGRIWSERSRMRICATTCAMRSTLRATSTTSCSAVAARFRSRRASPRTRRSRIGSEGSSRRAPRGGRSRAGQEGTTAGATRCCCSRASRSASSSTRSPDPRRASGCPTGCSGLPTSSRIRVPAEIPALSRTRAELDGSITSWVRREAEPSPWPFRAALTAAGSAA